MRPFRPSLLPALLILCGSLPAFSQSSRLPAPAAPPALVCLPARTLAHVRDTLLTQRAELTQARRTSADWARSSAHFEQAHLRDSTAYAGERDVSTSLQHAWATEHTLRLSDQAELVQATHKARKRGLLNWLLAVSLASVTALAITR